MQSSCLKYQQLAICCYCDQNGLQPVHFAAMCGHLLILKYLASLSCVDANVPSLRVSSCHNNSVMLLPFI